MTSALILPLALLLDATLGEPRWLWSWVPHPAVVMGRAIAMVEARANQGRARHFRGAAALAVLAALAVGLGLAASILLPWWAQAVLAAILLAQRSLCDHVRAVAGALDRSTADGRAAVAQIVGRDTAAMDDPAVARAAVESAAENLSDGVVAPALFLAVFGLPGLFGYKLVNTADSMIGYRTPRHAAFGWAAARTDDALNLIPARLTALLILLVQFHWPGRAGWRGLVADANLHRSPNAGWPEAAMARVLGIALSGPRSYDGTTRDFPFVNATGRKTVAARDIRAAVAVLWRVWGVVFGTALALAATAG